VSSTQTRRKWRGTGLGLRCRATGSKAGSVVQASGPPGAASASSIWFFGRPSQVAAGVPRTGLT